MKCVYTDQSQKQLYLDGMNTWYKIWEDGTKCAKMAHLQILLKYFSTKISDFALLHFISIGPDRGNVQMLCCGFLQVFHRFLVAIALFRGDFRSQNVKKGDHKYFIHALFQLPFFSDPVSSVLMLTPGQTSHKCYLYFTLLYFLDFSYRPWSCRNVLKSFSENFDYPQAS